MRGGNVGGHADAPYMRHFFLRAFFDRDVLARGNCEVERGDGRGDEKRHAVFAGENGDSVGADFVGGVAVASDAVGSDDYCANSAGLHKVTYHIVRDELERDAFFAELPGGEARSLQIGTSFRYKNFELATGFDGDADYSERRADATRG